jgi:hypothetical protein
MHVSVLSSDSSSVNVPKDSPFKPTTLIDQPERVTEAADAAGDGFLTGCAIAGKAKDTKERRIALDFITPPVYRRTAPQ